MAPLKHSSLRGACYVLRVGTFKKFMTFRRHYYYETLTAMSLSLSLAGGSVPSSLAT